MSFPNGLTITTPGRALQAKAQLGVQLNFTKIQIGNGILSGQLPGDMTALISPKKDVDITRLSIPGVGEALIGGAFNNTGVVTGFYFKEIGIFATDPDAGEILYCYGNAGDAGEYIPADSGGAVLEKFVNVITKVGSASNVTATINQSLVFANKEELDEHTDNIEIHVTQEKQVVWDNKVDKIAGKGLSANDYNTEDKLKVDKIVTNGDGTGYFKNDGTYGEVNVDLTPLENQINNVNYDLLTLWMEQYFLGNLPYSPYVENAKSLMFDGFLNTDGIDSINSNNVLVDTSNKLVGLSKLTQALTKPFSIGYGFSGSLSNTPNMIDGNEGTYGTISMGGSYSKTSMELRFNYPYMEQRDVTSITVRFSFTDDNSPYLRYVRLETDSAQSSTSIASTGYLTYSKGNTYVVTLSVPSNYKNSPLFLAFDFGSGQDPTIQIYEIYATGTLYLTTRNTDGSFKSKVKNLPSPVTKAKLHLSVKEPVNTSVVPKVSNNNGTLFNTCTLLSSRVDTKYSDYTEKEYDITFNEEDSDVIIDLGLSTSDNTKTPEVKRYGIYFS